MRIAAMHHTGVPSPQWSSIDNGWTLDCAKLHCRWSI